MAGCVLTHDGSASSVTISDTRIVRIHLTSVRLQPTIYFCTHKDSLPETRQNVKPQFDTNSPKNSVKTICRMKLLARSLRRVMIGNQPPAPLLLYQHPGKASVAG